jgi:hypothetical protein
MFKKIIFSCQNYKTHKLGYCLSFKLAINLIIKKIKNQIEHILLLIISNNILKPQLNAQFHQFNQSALPEKY